MRVKDMINFLEFFNGDDEVQIEIYETASGRYLDSTASIAISDNWLEWGPALQIDVEQSKFCPSCALLKSS